MVGPKELHLMMFSDHSDMIDETVSNMDTTSACAFIFALISTQEDDGTLSENAPWFYSLSLRHGIVYG